jgi:hypothetical protein
LLVTSGRTRRYDSQFTQRFQKPLNYLRLIFISKSNPRLISDVDGSRYGCLVDESHMFLYPPNQRHVDSSFDRSSALLVVETRRFTACFVAPPSDLAIVHDNALPLADLVRESMLAVRARLLRGEEPAPSDLARHEPSVTTTVWRVSAVVIEIRRWHSASRASMLALTYVFNIIGAAPSVPSTT